MAASEELLPNAETLRAFAELEAGEGQPCTVEEACGTLPVFWDGTPGTLKEGMVCREGKESASVTSIIPCINGVVIIGLVSVDSMPHNINITQPRKHPLSDVEDEAERRKLWEYDQL